MLRYEGDQSPRQEIPLFEPINIFEFNVTCDRHVSEPPEDIIIDGTILN
jgi:hypothetical protein